MKGIYVLFAELECDKQIKVGKLGKIGFRKGFYAYVGSAMNNLEKRIRRHLKGKRNYIGISIGFLGVQKLKT